jgi:uncharacterized protein
MILIDVNLLLHAYNARSLEHEAARRWLESTLNGHDLVCLTGLTVWAFIRISTNPRAFTRPLTLAEAEAAVDGWLAQQNVEWVEPGERHWEILRELLREGQATGPLVMDAVLAAIAIEHGAVLQTTDRDFSKFPGLKFENPIAGR